MTAFLSRSTLPTLLMPLGLTIQSVISLAAGPGVINILPLSVTSTLSLWSIGSVS